MSKELLVVRSMINLKIKQLTDYPRKTPHF